MNFKVQQAERNGENFKIVGAFNTVDEASCAAESRHINTTAHTTRVLDWRKGRVVQDRDGRDLRWERV